MSHLSERGPVPSAFVSKWRYSLHQRPVCSSLCQLLLSETFHLFFFLLKLPF